LSTGGFEVGLPKRESSIAGLTSTFVIVIVCF
jgi:hypothetical protein